MNYSESDHHTVVPLAVARKRMSEILSYKANECSSKGSSPVSTYYYVEVRNVTM